MWQYIHAKLFFPCSFFSLAGSDFFMHALCFSARVASEALQEKLAGLCCVFVWIRNENESCKGSRGGFSGKPKLCMHSVLLLLLLLLLLLRWRRSLIQIFWLFNHYISFFSSSECSAAMHKKPKRKTKEGILFILLHARYHLPFFFFCVPHVDYIHFLALLCFRTLLLLIIIIIIIIIVGLSVCLVWLSSWTQ